MARSRTQSWFYSRRLSLGGLLLCSLFLSGNVNAAVVLQYHHISDDTPKATSVSPALFKQHLTYLQDHGYRVVPLPDLVEALRQQQALPDKAVAITFDDGYESVYHQAFPMLKKHGWPFTVFVNSRPIEQGLTQFVSWGQLREMVAHGATIANHSLTHPHFLRRLDGESEAAWRERITGEIQTTEQHIREQTGQQYRFIAYPYGEFDAAVKSLAKDLGYIGFGQQSGPLSAFDDLQALPRFPFGGAYGAMEDFATKVASLPMPLTAVTALSASGAELNDTVLPIGEVRPRLLLTLRDTAVAQRIQCFASGQGAIAVTPIKSGVSAQAPSAVPVGRSRYNCTASSSQPGRFHWYSQLFIRKQDNGDWYPEP